MSRPYDRIMQSRPPEERNFVRILRTNPCITTILDRAPQLGLSEWYLTAGAVFQNDLDVRVEVRNERIHRPLRHDPAPEPRPRRAGGVRIQSRPVAEGMAPFDGGAVAGVSSQCFRTTCSGSPGFQMVMSMWPSPTSTAEPPVRSAR